MAQIKEIEKLSIWREYVPMYRGSRYCLRLKITNEDGSQYQWLPNLTYGGKWEEHTTHLCRQMNKEYDKKELKKIGEEIIRNCERLSGEYYLTTEMHDRLKDIGSLLFRGIIR